MPTSKEAAAAVAATAANDAIQSQAALAAQQAILARQAAAAAAQRAEFTYLAGAPPNRRTVAQNNRLAVFLATVPMTQQAGPTALHALSTSVQVLEMPRGGTVYRLNDPSDGFYVVVDGRVTLYDVKDREEAESDDGVAERLSRTDCFGEEDLLSNSRRAHRADVAADCSTILLRVAPEMYRKYLQHLHQPDFEDKVSFLAQLEVFRTLPDETLRKLAPCFSQVELRAKEYLVRQGERADSMFAIASGQCSVLVDPNFRPETSGLPAECDPKKAMQVCLIGPGNIVGDMTVLANVRKRTASILCLSDLVTYKIRRATFIRRVPGVQLEALRQVAEAKLRITERRLNSAQAGPGSGGGGPGGGGGQVQLSLRDKILHGYDLRQLSQPTTAMPVELRNLGSRSLNGAAENLLASSLASMAAAAAAGGDGSGAAGGGGGYMTTTLTPSLSYGGMNIGGAGPLSAAAATSVASMSTAAAAAYGGWTGGGAGPAVGDARMRFSGPRRNTSLHVPYNGAGRASSSGVPGTGAGGGCGGGDRATAIAGMTKSRSRTGAAMAALVGGPRTQEINFTWGLGPGTLINTLLERPATAAHSRRSAPLPSAAMAAAVAAAAAAANGNGGADPAAAAAAFAAAAAAAAGDSDAAGGRFSSPAVPLLSSSLSSQLQPTPSHQGRQATQHLSFNYGRPGATAGNGGGSGGSGGGGGGLYPGGRGSNGSAFGTLGALQGRWATDSFMPGPTPPPSYSSIPSAEYAASFSVVGVGVAAPMGPPPGYAGVADGAAPGGGLRRTTSRTSRLAPEVISSGISASGLPVRASITQPNGIYAATAAEQHGAIPASQSAPLPLASPAGMPTAADAADAQPESGPSSPSAPVKKGTRRVGLSVELALPPGDDTDGGGVAIPNAVTPTPGSRGSMVGSLWGGHGDASQYPDQGSDGEAGLGSPQLVESPGKRRGMPRRQKSMGKARFGPRVVTQNSSVDALVAEAIVSVLTKDVMLQQALAVEAALAAEEAAMRAGATAEGAEGRQAAGTGLLAEGEEQGRAGVEQPGEPSGGMGTVAEEEEESPGGEQEAPDEDDARATPETSEEADMTPRTGVDEGEGQEERPVEEPEAVSSGEAAGAGGPQLDDPPSDGPGGADGSDGGLLAHQGSLRQLLSGPGSISGVRAANDLEGSPTAALVSAQASWSQPRPPSAASARRLSEPGRRSIGGGSASLVQEGSGGSDASVASREGSAAVGRPAPPVSPLLPRQASHLSHLSASSSQQLLPSVSRSVLPDPHIGPLGASLSGEASRPGSAGAGAGASRLRRLSSVSMALGEASGGGGSAPASSECVQGGQASGSESRTAPGSTGSASMVASPPVLPRAVSRQPATLHLVLPDAAGHAGASRYGGIAGLSPPRRSLPSPAVPRPYPYVGPFLSANKGTHLPPSLTQHMTTLPRPPPSAAASAGLGPGSGLRGVTPGDRFERQGGSSESRSGPSSVGDLAIGGGGTPAPVSQGTRGQLRKGGALYRPASLPRSGLAPPQF